MGCLCLMCCIVTKIKQSSHSITLLHLSFAAPVLALAKAMSSIRAGSLSAREKCIALALSWEHLLNGSMPTPATVANQTFSQLLEGQAFVRAIQVLTSADCQERREACVREHLCLCGIKVLASTPMWNTCKAFIFIINQLFKSCLFCWVLWS